MTNRKKLKRYTVTLTRQVVFSTQITVEADDEDSAIELAEEEIEDQDTDDVIADWTPDTWETFGQPEILEGAE